MRVLGMLRQVIGDSQIGMHKKRQEVLVAACGALLRGGRLWLTALGRHLRASGGGKHDIKRADRLLGNGRLYEEREAVYRVMARRALLGKHRPVIVIDWSVLTADGAFHLLRASLAVGGRALTLYEEVHPEAKLSNRKVQGSFLRTLRPLLPAECCPILLTDSGFRNPWFQAVTALGWDYLGRVRNRTKVQAEGHDRWMPAKAVYAQATLTPRSLGRFWLAKSNPIACRLVLVRQRKRGRIARNRHGQRRRQIGSQRAAKQAREPWLLCTSLDTVRAAAIVHLYRSRMQIEESFRDTKTQELGWGLEHTGTRTLERLQVLLLVAALATLAVWLAGLAAEQRRLDITLQANTVRTRKVFSTVFLGRLVLSRFGSSRLLGNISPNLKALYASVLTLEAT